MLLGVICGLGTYFQYLNFNLGEMIYIAVGLFYMIKNGKICYDKYLKIFIISMSTFILYTGIYTILPVINQSNIIKNVFKYIEILLIVTITYQFLSKNREKTKKFLIAYFITYFFVTSINYSSVYSVSYIHRATYILIFFSAIQYDKVYEKKGIVLAIALMMAIYGKSRTALVIILVVVIYYFYQKIIECNINKKQLITKFSILLVSFITIFLGIQYMSEELQMETASNEERKELISVAIKSIKENPIFGIGPGNFSQYAIEKGNLNIESNKTVHNLFLEILVEYGIIGFVLFILPYIFIIKKLLKRENENSRMHWYAIYLIVFYLFNVMSGDARLEYGVLLGISLFSISNSYKKETKYEDSNDSVKL